MAVPVTCWNSYLSGTSRLKTVIKHPTLPYQFQCSNRFKFRKRSSVRLMPKNIATVKIEHKFCNRHDVKCCTYVQRNHQLISDDDVDEQPFFRYIKELFSVVKTILSFSAEQPSQLKYIEWPSIQSTLKTAILALILVAVFIVAITSVDSALSFVLALLSRRSA